MAHNNSGTAGAARWGVPGSDRRHAGGFTLMEVMVALGIFVIVMAATAQGLISSFAGIKIQEERTSAMNACRSVMSTLRQLAVSQPASDLCPEDTVMFPCVMVNFVNNFPATEQDIGSDTLLAEVYGGFFSLPEQRFEIELTDADGAAVTVNSSILSANTNPVFVRVSTTWRGFRGQTLRFDVHSIITNR